jgi:phosphoenolpyruvate carboxylase
MSNTATSSRADARFDMPEPLRADVRLLGELLGQVLVEHGGPRLLADVERLRELTIAAHADPPTSADQARDQAAALVEGWPLERADEVARAFTVYFHLVNLAEERHRVRMLQERDRKGDPGDDSLSVALREAAQQRGPDHVRSLLADLELRPVITAHPTEARRRAVVTGIRRVADLLERVDGARPGLSEPAELRRSLLEEIDGLWRTAQLRQDRPGPLDEVRAAMAVFDEVLFRVVPQVYRRADNALAGAQAGTEQPRVPAFVRFGSWIGGDRDGNPSVTAAVTREAAKIHADHVLRGLEAACDRIGRALTADATSTPPSPAAARILEDAAVAHPEVVAALTIRARNEPHRIALLLAGYRVGATRRGDSDLAYASVTEFLSQLRVIQASLAAAGAPRQAYGELQHLIWQAETFGFHLAELEVRQHSTVHARALANLNTGPKVTAETEEVLATFRVIADLQQRYGQNACRRYVVSFTRDATDVAAVYELARLALAGREATLDVVPLFETSDDLERCVDVMEEVVALPRVRQRLDANGRRLEVMLGYSDSAKDVGPVSATLRLHEAQARLASWARRHGIRLTLFHGRGGALGRGGGPVYRAVLAQPAGSVDGRFKVTEQGEVLFARYGNPVIAARHLEQVASAVVLASTPTAERRTEAATAAHTEMAEVLDRAARQAFHALVHSTGFAEWFARVTPLEELATLHIGSRPARRGLSVSSLDDLRAIPWVFAWAQIRVNVPGWYGLGSGLAAVGDVDRLRQAYTDWPLFKVLLENTEMSLAKTDRRIARQFLELGNRPDLTTLVLDEHARTIEWVLAVTGHDRLLEDRPVLAWAVALRNPYVDALSHLQLRALRALRADGSDSDVERLQRLLLLTVNGVAAGLQNTG